MLSHQVCRTRTEPEAVPEAPCLVVQRPDPVAAAPPVVAAVAAVAVAAAAAAAAAVVVGAAAAAAGAVAVRALPQAWWR